MPIDYTLLSVMIPILVGAAIGMVSGNTYLGAGSSVVILSWVAAETQNSFILGAWLLLLMIMALSVGRTFATAILGDVA